VTVAIYMCVRQIKQSKVENCYKFPKFIHEAVSLYCGIKMKVIYMVGLLFVVFMKDMLVLEALQCTELLSKFVQTMLNYIGYA